MNERYQKQIDAGIAAMQKWRNNEPCVIFPIITDLHSHLVHTDPLICMRRRCIEHLECCTHAAELAGADFAADLGDDGFDVPLKTREDFQTLLERMSHFYRSAKLPLIHCIGNHDTRMMSNADWGKWNCEMNAGKLALHGGADDSYGYFDLAAKKCRVFFLNTSDGKYVGISAEQTAFVEGKLQELPSDWCVIILTHVSPLTRGQWRTAPPTDENFRFPEFCMMLQRFAGQGGKIAGVFSGDSHAHFFDYEDGVNYFVSQGYGGCSTETEKPQHMAVFHEYSETLKRTDTFNSDEYCMLDLVAVKLQKREIRIFRIGAGGSRWDRGAKY